MNMKGALLLFLLGYLTVVNGNKKTDDDLKNIKHGVKPGDSSIISLTDQNTKAKLMDQMKFTMNNVKDILETIILASETANKIRSLDVKHPTKINNKAQIELRKSVENVQQAMQKLSNTMNVWL